MKFVFALLLFTSVAFAECQNYVIGFKGKGGVFDHESFEQYAQARHLCSLVYHHEQVDQALEFMNSFPGRYQLYGFSAGASSVAQVVKRAVKKPGYVITMGAHHTTDVDFNRYEIDFDNFFDASGRGNPSPGIHFPNISHGHIQKFVNEFFN
jgi:hypothetical protein